MKAALLILTTILYSIGVFLVDSSIFLWSLFSLELVILLVLSWKTLHVKSFVRNGCFILFVVLCNLGFSDWQTALLIGLRLSLLIMSSYIISDIISPSEFAAGVAELCAPLRLFKVDTGEIALTITIALTFVPLFTKEARSLQNNLKLKGYTFFNVWSRPQVYVVGMTERLFQYIDSVEVALKLKGY